MGDVTKRDTAGRYFIQSLAFLYLILQDVMMQ
jgi:hypothetical protein